MVSRQGAKNAKLEQARSQPFPPSEHLASLAAIHRHMTSRAPMCQRRPPVAIGQASLRKGTAGRPSAFTRLTSGLMSQP